MDGLVYPDRTPHTGLKGYKNVNRPIRAYAEDIVNGEFTLWNVLDFTDAADAVTLVWEVTVNGDVRQKGTAMLPHIAPHGREAIKIPYTMPEEGSAYLRLIYLQKGDKAMTDSGFELGFDQFKLPVDREEFTPDCDVNAEFEICENEFEYRVSVNGLEYAFDSLYRRKGVISSLKKNGKQLFQKPMEYNVWRAPIDNDRNILNSWKAARFNKTYSRTYTSSVLQEADRVSIETECSITAKVVQPIVKMKNTFTIFADGTLQIDIHADRDVLMIDPPRFGVRFFIPESYNDVEYTGYGPDEAYKDKNFSSYFGKFRATTQELHEDYITPQENGSHCMTEKLVLKSGKETFNIISNDSFSFNASEYTQEELTEKRHNFELEKSGHTVLCIDYDMCGVGSNSCGPELLDQYRLKEASMDMTFFIKIN